MYISNLKVLGSWVTCTVRRSTESHHDPLSSPVKGLVINSMRQLQPTGLLTRGIKLPTFSHHISLIYSCVHSFYAILPTQKVLRACQSLRLGRVQAPWMLRAPTPSSLARRAPSCRRSSTPSCSSRYPTTLRDTLCESNRVPLLGLYWASKTDAKLPSSMPLSATRLLRQT